MAVVKCFHCKYLCEGRDVFGSSLKQTGNSAQTDHKISIGLNASSISSLPPQSISLLSNLMLLTGSFITKLPGSRYLPAEKKPLRTFSDQLKLSVKNRLTLAVKTCGIVFNGSSRHKNKYNTLTRAGYIYHNIVLKQRTTKRKRLSLYTKRPQTP